MRPFFGPQFQSPHDRFLHPPAGKMKLWHGNDLLAGRGGPVTVKHNVPRFAARPQDLYQQIEFGCPGQAAGRKERNARYTTGSIEGGPTLPR